MTRHVLSIRPNLKWNAGRMAMCLASLSMAMIAWGGEATAPLDILEMGKPDSEQLHGVIATHSDTIRGALGEPARRLLAPATAGWEGGRVGFTLKVDPQKQNYVTVRLWGSDVSRNRLVLFCEGKQVGYQHLGDIDLLDFGGDGPAYNGRFFYSTTPIPLETTRGKSTVPLEIRSTGPINRFGATLDAFQHPMQGDSRGIYRVYSHTDECFVPPTDEKQGEPPLASPAPTAGSPGPEVLEQVKERVSRELNGILKSARPPGQLEMQFIAKAYHVKWTPAYQNPKAVEQVVKGADKLSADFRRDPKIAEDGPGVYNPGWLGLGPAADAVRLLAEPLKALLAAPIDNGQGGKTARSAAWSKMFVASRDFHLRHRRQYTNQTMITDLNSYLDNRAVEVVDPEHALPEERMLHLLYEAAGIDPWLGSDTDHGPEKPLGSDYFQLTKKGLTKELGFVGNYGEVLDWATHIYDATRDPGEPGDEKIRQQLASMERARGVFRYPMLDADGNRAMRMEAVIGWRDDHYPADVTYGERSAWEGSAICSAAATLDHEAIGYAQQMFADNQFFRSVKDLLKDNGIRVTQSLLWIPDQYATLLSQSPSPRRLPMTEGQPDFVFSDEEDGVIAIKHGEDILFASLYWRARTAVNFLARTHYIVPRFDRIAVVHEEAEFEPSGQTYTRPDWIAMGFGNGGVKYPGIHSANAGEKLPIAQVPDGMKFKPGDENVHAGKASFYTLCYGPYLIGMNTTKEKTSELKVAPEFSKGRELVSGKPVNGATSLTVPPCSTVVVYRGEAALQAAR